MNKKLYVGNMNYSTTEDGLRTLFAQYGTVASIHLITDQQTGKSKGFGFVEMSSEEEAQKAIEGLNGYQMDGRALKINEAHDKKERDDEDGFRKSNRRF
jgi:RNA recognition motif-containing protein